jgi:hypothetical protein
MTAEQKVLHPDNDFQVTPSKLVDELWHAHIQRSPAYFQLCLQHAPAALRAPRAALRQAAQLPRGRVNRECEVYVVARCNLRKAAFLATGYGQRQLRCPTGSPTSPASLPPRTSS